MLTEGTAEGRAIRRQALRDAAAAMCRHCAAGVPHYEGAGGAPYQWHKLPRGMAQCAAAGVHRLMAREG